jgi:uroporphyrinogen-III synthase
MGKNKINILSTKKLSRSTIEQAKEQGIDVIEHEFISVKPITTKETHAQIKAVVLTNKISDVVFTSANAVAAIKTYLDKSEIQHVPDWNIFCISGKTKQALAQHIDPNKIIATAENALTLAKKIIEKNRKEIIFFCGNRRKDDLPLTLKNAGISVREIVVYETIPTPHKLENDLEGILFFSPSAVISFFSANLLKKNINCFSIGSTTATLIKDFTDN